MDGGLPARVIADNRVTIPEEFRERYDLERGDRIWIKVRPADVGDGDPYSHAAAVSKLNQK